MRVYNTNSCAMYIVHKQRASNLFSNLFGVKSFESENSRKNRKQYNISKHFEMNFIQTNAKQPTNRQYTIDSRMCECLSV